MVETPGPRHLRPLNPALDVFRFLVYALVSAIKHFLESIEFTFLYARCTLCFNQLQYIKSNLSLYSLDYAEACNELAGPISASLRPGNTAPFEEMSQRWRAVGNTVSDLTGPRFEPQTSRSRDERVTARPSGRLINYIKNDT